MLRSKQSDKSERESRQTITSRLLPEVFAGFEDGDAVTVLDLGPGNSQTLSYLSRFRAKVIFADLLESPVFSADQVNVESKALAGFIERQLDLPPNTRIDVCLMWDYLHHMELVSVTALATVLEASMHDATRGYGFGALHGAHPPDNNQYGIANSHALLAVPLAKSPAYIAHSQQHLTEHFPALRITRGTLLRQGRLELLFER